MGKDKKKYRVYKAGGTQGSMMNPTAQFLARAQQGMQQPSQEQMQMMQQQQMMQQESSQDRLIKLIEAYAKISQTSPDEIIAKLQQQSEEKQGLMIQQMEQAVQEQGMMQSQQQDMPTYAPGGSMENGECPEGHFKNMRGDCEKYKYYNPDGPKTKTESSVQDGYERRKAFLNEYDRDFGVGFRNNSLAEANLLQPDLKLKGENLSINDYYKYVNTPDTNYSRYYDDTDVPDYEYALGGSMETQQQQAEEQVPMAKAGYVKMRVKEMMEGGQETNLEASPTINDMPDGRETLVSNFNQGLKDSTAQAQAEKEYDDLVAQGNPPMMPSAKRGRNLSNRRVARIADKGSDMYDRSDRRALRQGLKAGDFTYDDVLAGQNVLGKAGYPQVGMPAYDDSIDDRGQDILETIYESEEWNKAKPSKPSKSSSKKESNAIQPNGDPYEYKKENGKLYTRKKGSGEWIEVDPESGAGTAIREKVYGETGISNKDADPFAGVVGDPDQNPLLSDMIMKGDVDLRYPYSPLNEVHSEIEIEREPGYGTGSGSPSSMADLMSYNPVAGDYSGSYYTQPTTAASGAVNMLDEDWIASAVLGAGLGQELSALRNAGSLNTFGSGQGLLGGGQNLLGGGQGLLGRSQGLLNQGQRMLGSPGAQLRLFTEGGIPEYNVTENPQAVNNLNTAYTSSRSLLSPSMTPELATTRIKQMANSQHGYADKLDGELVKSTNTETYENLYPNMQFGGLFQGRQARQARRQARRDDRRARRQMRNNPVTVNMGDGMEYDGETVPGNFHMTTKYGLFGRPRKVDIDMSGFPVGYMPSVMGNMFGGGMFGGYGSSVYGTSGGYGINWQDPIEAAKENNKKETITDADIENKIGGSDATKKAGADAIKQMKESLERMKNTPLKLPGSEDDPYGLWEGVSKTQKIKQKQVLGTPLTDDEKAWLKKLDDVDNLPIDGDDLKKENEDLWLVNEYQKARGYGTDTGAADKFLKEHPEFNEKFKNYDKDTDADLNDGKEFKDIYFTYSGMLDDRRRHRDEMRKTEQQASVTKDEMDEGAYLAKSISESSKISSKGLNDSDASLGNTRLDEFSILLSEWEDSPNMKKEIAARDLGMSVQELDTFLREQANPGEYVLMGDLIKNQVQPKGGLGAIQYVLPTSVGTGAVNLLSPGSGASGMLGSGQKMLGSGQKMLGSGQKMLGSGQKMIGSPGAQLRLFQPGGFVDANDPAYGNPDLYKFISGGIDQADIDYFNSKDVTDDYMHGGIPKAQDGLEAYNKWRNQNAESQALSEYNRYMNRTDENGKQNMMNYTANTDDPVYNKILQGYQPSMGQFDNQRSRNSNYFPQQGYPGGYNIPQGFPMPAAGYPGGYGRRRGMGALGQLGSAVFGNSMGYGQLGRQPIFTPRGQYWKQTKGAGVPMDMSKLSRLQAQYKQGLLGPKGKVIMDFQQAADNARSGMKGQAAKLEGLQEQGEAQGSMSNRAFANKYGNKALGLGSKGQMRRALRRGDMTQEEYMKAMSEGSPENSELSGVKSEALQEQLQSDPTEMSIEDQKMYGDMNFDSKGNMQLSRLEVKQPGMLKGPEGPPNIIGSGGKPYASASGIVPLPIKQPTEFDADRWKFSNNPEQGAGITYNEENVIKMYGGEYGYGGAYNPFRSGMKEGGVYDLTEDEIGLIMAAGGSVEYI